MTLTKQNLEAFQYLNHLRLTGITNMFGATPYIQQRFPSRELTKHEARDILTSWMSNYQEDSENYKLNMKLKS
tara:strand:+ start:7192 stop:7410 length:219 start_codon:yes stop_codon:yes gene_type:complete